MTGRPPVADHDHVVFSYGTLQQSDVQQAVLGCALTSRPDRLPGYRLDWITITDPDVIAISGSNRHPILHRDTEGKPVTGTALSVTPEQLRLIDAYEVDDYDRELVRLESGIQAWAFTLRPAHARA